VLQARSSNLRAVVEVVPVVAGAHPVIVCSGVVGLVIGIGGRVVQLAGLRVLAGSLGVEGGSSLTVKGREHLHRPRQERKQEEARVGGRHGGAKEGRGFVARAVCMGGLFSRQGGWRQMEAD